MVWRRAESRRPITRWVDWSAEIGDKRITSPKKTLEDMIATSRHKP